jgi:hypothetical protein
MHDVRNGRKYYMARRTAFMEEKEGKEPCRNDTWEPPYFLSPATCTQYYL